MTDEQLLKQYYNEEWREGMPPFSQITDEYKQAILGSIHFVAYKCRIEAIDFWNSLERRSMTSDIKKQKDSKK